jgi:hypothetical protein
VTAYLEETCLNSEAKTGAQLEETSAQQEETGAQLEETQVHNLRRQTAQLEETRVHNLRRRAQLEETNCTT